MPYWELTLGLEMINDKLKIGVLNAHSLDQIYTPLAYFILNRRAHKKYDAISEYFRNKGYFYFDMTESSFVGQKTSLKLTIFIFLLNIIEIPLWCKINRIPLSRVRLLSKKSKVEYTSITIFSYKHFLNFSQAKSRRVNQFKKVYIHLSHYMLAADLKSSLAQTMYPNAVLLTDSDFVNNCFFKLLYSHEVKILPFNVQKRFRLTADEATSYFKQRSEKIVIGGTIQNLLKGKDAELTEYFRFAVEGSDYHYLRRSLSELDDAKFLNLCENLKVCEELGIDSSIETEGFYPAVFKRVKFCCFGDEIAGAVAISNLEAMSCGVLPFISGVSLSGLPFTENLDFVYCPTNPIEFQKWFELNKLALDQIYIQGYTSRIQSGVKLEKYVYKTLEKFKNE